MGMVILLVIVSTLLRNTCLYVGDRVEHGFNGTVKF